jgi:hypothetical protein
VTNSKIGKNCDLGTVQHLLGITYVIYFYIPMILTEKKSPLLAQPNTCNNLRMDRMDPGPRMDRDTAEPTFG